MTLQNTTAIAYALRKDKLFVGYLIGAMHYSFNPQEYQNIKNKLKPIIQDCSIVFLECDLPHSTQMGLGYEKAVKEILETDYPTTQLAHFETLLLQKAMLLSSLWLGNKIIHLPWLDYKMLKKAPAFFYYLSLFTQKLFFLYNFFFNIFRPNLQQQALREHLAKAQQQVLEIYQNFINGIAIPLTSLDNKMVLMTDRNHEYIDQIEKQSPQKRACYVVGVGHLPSTCKEDGTAENNGMVYLLEKAGYSLEAITL
jgi:hypothetical protein